MPLRDHTVRPYNGPRFLEALHGVWPTIMGQSLNARLPHRYHIEAGIHLGRVSEFDVAGYERDVAAEPGPTESDTLTAVLPEPTLVRDTEPPEETEYELRLYDDELGRLVAIVELASPSNKDRPQSRSAFAMKCANYWKRGISVSIIDIVAQMRFNLYADALDLIGHEDPAFSGRTVPQYAATFRARNGLPDNGWRLESWAYPLTTGHPLPKLPLFLAHDDSIMLDLEATYEQAFRDFRLDLLSGAK